MTHTIGPELLTELHRLRDCAYAPYSRHPVAVVLETTSGRQFGGGNVEVAHFKSICAEASAISAMIAAGETTIARLWVLGPSDRPCPPCGDCRQRIREFGSGNMQCLAVDDHGRVLLVRSLDQLLPDSFGPDHLAS